MDTMSSFRCSHCRRRFINSERASDHVAKCSAGKASQKVVQLRCDSCGLYFIGKAGLAIHQNHCDGSAAASSTKAPNVTDPDQLTVTYECVDCSRSFQTAAQLMTHSSLQHATKLDKQYQCDMCDKAFSHSSNLIGHRNAHNSVRPYDCQECDASFFSAGALKSHTSRHHRIRRIVCDICGAFFKETYALNQHMLRKHTDPSLWPFKCRKCDDRFVTRQAVEMHNARNHAFELYCSRCGKGFQEQMGLTVHLDMAGACERYKRMATARSAKSQRNEAKIIRQRASNPRSPIETIVTRAPKASSSQRKARAESHLTGTSSAALTVPLAFGQRLDKGLPPMVYQAMLSNSSSLANHDNSSIVSQQITTVSAPPADSSPQYIVTGVGGLDPATIARIVANPASAPTGVSVVRVGGGVAASHTTPPSVPDRHPNDLYVMMADDDLFVESAATEDIAADDLPSLAPDDEAFSAHCGKNIMSGGGGGVSVATSELPAAELIDMAVKHGTVLDVPIDQNAVSVPTAVLSDDDAAACDLHPV